MGWVYKLVSGGDSLDLSSGTQGSAGAYCIENVGLDAPARTTEMTLRIIFYLGAANQVDAARRLEQQITQYLVWAEAYERKERRDPVELWVMRNDGVGVEPSFGLGSKRRRITGGEIVPPFSSQAIILNEPTIPGFILRLKCYDYWYAKRHWALCGRGGIIEDTADGGLEIWAGTTNLCEYPSLSSGWTIYQCSVADSFIDYASGRQRGNPKFGRKFMTETISAGFTSCAIIRNEITGAPVPQTTYTLSAYVRGRGNALGRAGYVQIYETGGAAVTASSFTVVTLTSDWQRVVVTHAMQQADRTAIRTDVGMRAGYGFLEGDEMDVDGVQLEGLAYSTPFADGEQGLGHRWTGTAEASTSVRDAAVLVGSSWNQQLDRSGWNSAPNWDAWEPLVNPSAGTVSLWLKDVDWNSGIQQYFWDTGYSSGAINRIIVDKSAANNLEINVVNQSGASQVVQVAAGTYVDASWYHVCGCWANNDLRLYVNGVSVGTPLVALLTPIVLPSTFYIGTRYSATVPANCTIHSDFRLYSQALTTTQVASMYASGRGPGILPYVGALAAGTLTDPPTIRINNHEDLGPHQNWVQIGNVPGDREAATRWWLCYVTARASAFYYGAYAKQTERVKFSYSAYNFSATYDATTAVVADANATYGNKARTTAVTTAWVRVMVFTVNNMPGRWRIYARVYDGAAALGVWHIRARAVIEYTSAATSKAAFPYTSTAGVSAPAVSEWDLVELGELELPSVWAKEDGQSCQIELELKRDSGATTFDTDFILLSPVNMEGVFGTAGAAAGPFDLEQNAICDEPYMVEVNPVIPYFGIQGGGGARIARGSYISLVPRTQTHMYFAEQQTSSYMLDITDNMDFCMRIEPRYNTPW